MSKVILFGTGKGSLIVESALKDNIQIVCYLDNDKEKWNTIHNEKQIINPEHIYMFDYDYIIIASQFIEPIYNQLLSYGIDKNIIFRFYAYIDYYQNIVKKELEQLKTSEDDCEIIATGLSYMNYALMNAKLCSKKIISVANASQDLYYDFNIVKYILRNYKLKSLKKVLIGMCYYSFQYDMSLSAMKEKVPIYYEAIGLEHHFKNSKEKLDIINMDKKLSKILLNFDVNERVIVHWGKDVEQNIKLTDEEGKRQVYIDSNKNYPMTVKENINILNEYLELLIDNRIEPVIIVCPVSKYYYRNFPEKLKIEFYKILNEFKEKYNLRIYDYFESDFFDKKDFFDVSHLNSNGSNKFISLIDKVL